MDPHYRADRHCRAGAGVITSSGRACHAHRSGSKDRACISSWLNSCFQGMENLPESGTSWVRHSHQEKQTESKTCWKAEFWRVRLQFQQYLLLNRASPRLLQPWMATFTSMAWEGEGHWKVYAAQWYWYWRCHGGSGLPVRHPHVPVGTWTSLPACQWSRPSPADLPWGKLCVFPGPWRASHLSLACSLPSTSRYCDLVMGWMLDYHNKGLQPESLMCCHWTLALKGKDLKPRREGSCLLEDCFYGWW